MRLLRRVRSLHRLVKSWFRPLVMQVWHHDCPGTRVYVRRGVLKRFLYSSNFSHISERHLTIQQCFPHLAGAELLKKVQELTANFDSWQAFCKYNNGPLD